MRNYLYSLTSMLFFGVVLIMLGCSGGTPVGSEAEEIIPPDNFQQEALNTPAEPGVEEPVDEPEPEEPIVEPEPEEDPYEFALNVWDETYLDGGQAGSFDFTAIQSTWADPNLPGVEEPNTIEVTISVEDAVNLKALFFDVEYDTARLAADKIEYSDEIDAAGPFLMAPVVFGQPTVVHPDAFSHGVVWFNYAEVDGFSGSADLLTIIFTKAEINNPELALIPITPPSGAGNKHEITPPIINGAKYELEVDPETGTLNWWHCLVADNNQDYIVDLLDMIPLARYFASTDIDYSLLSGFVDSDLNGEVNIADITQIGQQWLCAIDGYNVYAGQPTDYPDGGELLEWVPVSAGVGDPAVDRLTYEYLPAEPQTGVVYWVSATYEELTGDPSEMVGGE